MIELQKLGLLDKLLVDKTTKGHILWGTDAYAERGEGYAKGREIFVPLILYNNLGVIKTRARKAFEQQLDRTKLHGEVFTPRWVCNMMIDAIDCDWFGIDKLPVDAWQHVEELFQQTKKSWKKYVDNKRLEITCGEAPYLVQRYDVADGEIMPVEERTGILDRKLHVVSAYTTTADDWIHWAIRAFEATFGYEYQGDNLLIARVNFMKTFIEFFQCKWNEYPDSKVLERLIHKITWNVWQMDGLTDTIPCSYDFAEEQSLFDVPQDKVENQPACKIRSWRGHKISSFSFKEMKGRQSGMKFDYIIGNPPYQEESKTVSKINGQQARKNIFQLFQLEVNNIAQKGIELIYPGGRWIHQSGKGLKEFGHNQINDTRLAKVILYADTTDVFKGVSIADGISIVFMDMNKKKPGFEYTYVKNGHKQTVHLNNPGDDLIPLDPMDLQLSNKLEKFVSDHSIKFMHDKILPRTLFGIESDFVSKNQDKVTPYLDGMNIDYTHQIKLFTNDKAGKSGRGKWFVTDKNTITNGIKYLSEWQVVVSSANAGGQKRDNQLQIIDNHSAFGRSRVALRSFKTLKEAENFYKYVSSTIIKYAFLLTDEALSSLGKKVPDLLNYKDDNGLIDFSKESVDNQLKQLIGLTDNEISYMQKKIKSLRGEQ